MADALPVVVAGAGIAGMTAALSLARRGRDVVLLERADHLDEIGAGIQLSPNAGRVLAGLGLAGPVDAVAVRPSAIRIRDARDGRDLQRLALDGVAARHGAPYRLIHRGELQALLLSAVKTEPRIRLSLGAFIETAEERGGRVALDVFFGEIRRTVEGDALIGADGVWSRTRTAILGGGAACYSGRTAWRTVIPIGAAGGIPIDELTTATSLWLGERAHLVVYPIRSGRMLNLIAAVDGEWVEERWDVPGDRIDLLRAFASWPKPVRDLLDRAETWRKWALCTAPDGPWARGRIALAGDAAHGMLPFVAQGGAMAIEDGAVLGRLVGEPGPTAMETRLAAYVSARRRRVRKVAGTAAANARIYHLSGLAADARNFAMRLMGDGGMLRRMDWIWGWRDEP